MSMRMRTGAIAIAALGVAGSTSAGTLRVCPGEYATIQSAVDAAATGDEVRICPGTYAEDVVVQNKVIRLCAHMGAVTVGSLTWTYDAGLTPFDGALEDITFTGDVTVDAWLSNLRITRCVVEGATHIDAYSDMAVGMMRLADSVFEGPVSVWVSGIDGCVDFSVCTFRGDVSAGRDGGPGPEVTGCTFDACSVSLDGEHVWLSECTITGGGAHVFADFSGHARGNTITGAVVGLTLEGDMSAEDNEIRDCGVGIETVGSTWSTYFYDVDGNRILDCGVGISASTFDFLSVQNNVVVRCDVGVYVQAGSQTSAAWLEHNTIDASVTDGMRLDIDPDDIEILDANIVTNGPSGIVLVRPGTPSPPPACNDVWGNGQNWSGIADPTGTNGNFSLDPLFCTATPDDRRIDPASPCASGHHPDGAACGRIGALDPCVVLDTPVTIDPPLARLRVIATPGPAPVRIAWDHPLSARAVLEIFDAAGARVGSVTARTGAQGVTWDGRTATGDRAAPGVYWARLARGDVEHVQRFVILW